MEVLVDDELACLKILTPKILRQSLKECNLDENFVLEIRLQMVQGRR
jgi:hypothetical protein